METRANHVLIGAFTLAVCLFAVLFALWAAKYASEKAYGEYEVVFEEAVTGLSVGSQVLYSGISVGGVRALSLDRDDPRKVVARVKVRKDTPVKVDTRAKLSFTGLTGTAFIQLTGGGPQSARALPPLPDAAMERVEADPVDQFGGALDVVAHRLAVIVANSELREQGADGLRVRIRDLAHVVHHTGDHVATALCRTGGVGRQLVGLL